MKVDFKVIEYTDDLPISAEKQKQEIKNLISQGYEVKGFSGGNHRYSVFLMKKEVEMEGFTKV